MSSVFMSKLRALTIELLETDPGSYLEILQSLSKNNNHDEKRRLKEKLNEKLYHSWNSNHLLCVAQLAGSIPESVRKEYKNTDSYYGSHLQDGIKPDIAIPLINLMFQCGCNILAKDAYHQNIIEIMDPTDKRFPRYGNREIKNHILKIYNYALCFQKD
jgi:hypothetical protein